MLTDVAYRVGRKAGLTLVVSKAKVPPIIPGPAADGILLAYESKSRAVP